MAEIRTKLVAALGSAIVALVGAGAAHTANAHPAHAHAHEEAERAATVGLQGEELGRYEALSAARDETPTDADAATAFARYAGTMGRRDGDDVLIAEAREALAPWADDPDAPSDLLTVRASLRQFDHEFAAAEADLSTVIGRAPNDTQALLSRAFVRAVTGDYAGAEADCQAVPTQAPALVRETCLARAASLRGRAEPALRRLAAATERYGVRDAQVTVFALGVLGDIAVRAGDQRTAEKAYDRALRIEPRSVFVRANLAELLIDQGRKDEAAALIEGAEPTEALLLARARLEGAEGAASRELESRMRTDMASGDARHAREHARFALEVLSDEALALSLAQANWKNQKEPIDALVLIRAAEAAGRPGAADPARAFIEENTLQDARLAQLPDDGAASGEAGGL